MSGWTLHKRSIFAHVCCWVFCCHILLESKCLDIIMPKELARFQSFIAEIHPVHKTSPRVEAGLTSGGLRRIPFSWQVKDSSGFQWWFQLITSDHDGFYRVKNPFWFFAVSERINQCEIYFLFQVLTTYHSDGNVSVMGMPISVPSRYACWVELVLIHYLVPNSSFTGHLSGILVGLMYTFGPLKKVVKVCVHYYIQYQY